MNTRTIEVVSLLTTLSVGLVLFALLKRRKSGNTPENKQALSQEYFRAGIDYHISARFAAFAGFIPVSGNLAHHAAEMYLKGYLCTKLSERERRNLGHRLRKIWKRFKAEVGDSSLATFDATISAIDKFERIRYPEEITRKGMSATVSFKRGISVGGTLARQPSFELVVDELDALAKVILEKSKVNPKFFTNGLNNDARTYLTQSNNAAIW